MSDLRKEAQMALEALENCTSEHGHRCNRCDSEVDEGRKVIDALRAALSAQHVPEAIPQDWTGIDPAVAFHLIERHAENWGHAGQLMEAWRLSNAPTVQPLTDEQCDKLRQENGGALNFVSLREFRVIARAVERAHGIGGTHG